MPIIYTPDQQAQIDAANTAVKNATTALNNAKANVTAQYNNLNNLFADARLSPYYYHRAGDGSLTAQLAVGQMDRHSCYASNPTIRLQPCIDAVSRFNTGYGDYTSAFAAQTAAQNNLNSANSALATLMTTLNNSPNVIQQQNSSTTSITSAAATQRAKWILFGLIALAIVVAAIFFAKKSI